MGKGFFIGLRRAWFGTGAGNPYYQDVARDRRKHPEVCSGRKASIFTEDDIRPDELMAGQEAGFAEDIAALMARRAEFVRVACPACGEGRGVERFRKYEMVFEECPVCRTISANPRPSPALLERYYATSKNYTYFNRYIFPASEAVRREKIFRPRVARLRELLERYEIPRRCLLEVGAGFGTFCEEVRAAELFERVIAVEPTPDLAATCRQRGLEVIEAPIERIVPPGGTGKLGPPKAGRHRHGAGPGMDPREIDHGPGTLCADGSGTVAPSAAGDMPPADVIVAFEVLEHLFCPREFVQTGARILTPGGLLVLTCPNGRGFDIDLMGPVSDAVDVEHLNLFNPDSLTALLEACGFEVLEVTTPGHLDAELVRKKVLAGHFDLSDHPSLQCVLIDEWETLGGVFQNLLTENGLSSHMWAVGRSRARQPSAQPY